MSAPKVNGTNGANGANGANGVNYPQTLHAACAVHDKDLPPYPLPALSVLQGEMIRRVLQLGGEPAAKALQASLARLGPSLEAAFEQALASLQSAQEDGRQGNWATAEYKTMLLSLRGPLSQSSLVFKLFKTDTETSLRSSESSGKREDSESAQISAAAELLRATAVLYTSPATVTLVGSSSSGKNSQNGNKKKKFETKQLGELFATTRVPGSPHDRLETHAGSRHAVVWHNNRAYKVGLVDAAFQPYSADAYRDQIRSIVDRDQASHRTSSGDSTQEYASFAPAASVAAMSTHKDRTTWAALRQRIQAAHADALSMVESAVTSIALPTSHIDSTHRFLEECRAGAQDVYSDQTLGFSVFPDGSIGGRVDHTVCDGGVIFRVVEQLQRAMADKAGPATAVASGHPTVAQEIVLDDDAAFLAASEEQAHCSTEALPSIDTVHRILFVSQPADVLDLLRSTGYLHAVVQLAFQASILSVSADARPPLMVEPMPVRAFADGRCDPTYIHTTESTALFQALAAGQPEGVLMQAFLAAASAYSENLRTTRSGRGIGPGMAVLRNALAQVPDSPDKAAVAQTLAEFQRPTAYFTGMQFSAVVDAVEANVFAPDQISGIYMGREDGISLFLAATGKFKDQTKRIEARFTECLQNIGALATAAAAVEQMYPGQGIERLSQYHNKSSSSSSSSNISSSAGTGSVAIHAGAGEMLGLLTDHERKLVEFLLGVVARVAADEVAAGAGAVDVAEHAVTALENCVFFNSGKGAVYTSEGTHELEACIVDGRTGAAGAVACVKTLRNPVAVAAGVMGATRHSLLAGAAADAFGADHGYGVVDQAYFHSAARQKQLAYITAAGRSKDPCASDPVDHPQTVGAVVCDKAGRLAAASSTGGVAGKLCGRIGDTAVVGAGTYADADVAVVCSGEGDAFLRHSVASAVAAAVTRGADDVPTRAQPDQPAQAVLDGLHRKTGAVGGILALTRAGQLCTAQTAQTFFVAASETNKGAPWSKVLRRADTDDQTPMAPFFRDDIIEAALSRRPTTKGDTVVRIRSGAGLGELARVDYQSVFLSLKQAALVMKTALRVARIALVATGIRDDHDNDSDDPSQIRLIPLHGITPDWTPHVDGQEEYNETYPGYISSKNGPRLSEQALDRVRDAINTPGAAEGPPAMDGTFFGEDGRGSLFGRIVRNREPQWRIWEGPGHVAFLTPFGNTPGFTVVVPRRQLGSDVLALSDPDLNDLAGALWDVSGKMQRAVSSIRGVGVILEGMEVDYAHAKLVPVQTTTTTTREGRRSPMVTTGPYAERYTGSVSSQKGAWRARSALQPLQDALVAACATAKTIQPTRTLGAPASHFLAALKSPWYRGVFRILDTMFTASTRYLGGAAGYKYALTPITTDCISSPLGRGSDSLPVRVELFGQPTYLADSMQFTLEYLLRFDPACAGAYYMSPSFRGEDPDPTHLNQFFHVECELRGSMDDAMRTAEGYIAALTRAMYREHRDLIGRLAGTTQHMTDLLARFPDTSPRPSPDTSPDTSPRPQHTFPCVPLDDAIARMPSDDCWEYAVAGDTAQGRKLTRKGERILLQTHGGFVWLTEMDHLSVPFYQAYCADRTAGPRKAKAGDLLMGLGETLGLGERHVTSKQVRAALDAHAVPHSPYEWYMSIRDTQELLSSGWGLGSERYLCWLLQHDDVRDLALIPRLKGRKFLP